MGRAVALHPLAVILAIATGVVTAGIVGGLVAVPLLAVVNTAVRYLAAHPDGEPTPDHTTPGTEPTGETERDVTEFGEQSDSETVSATDTPVEPDLTEAAGARV